jgi:predicted transcriptional regulator
LLWFIGLLGVAAAAVAAYNQLRRRDPDAAEQLVEVMREVTAVVVVISQAVVASLEALTRSPRSFATIGERPGYRWSDFDE